MFALNQWYVIADRSEVKDELLARTVCGRNLVIFRSEDGEPVILDDRCSHRAYPLSLGTLVNGEVQCGYHGLRFNCAGTCVWAPNQDRVPSKANLTPLPVAEVGPWTWVWMGDPDKADHTKLPSIPWYDDPEWTTVSGMEPLEARYELLVDNLLDLSHETFLHAGYIGTPEVAETPFTTSVDKEGEIVRVSRRMEGVECPPFYADSAGMASPIDRWQDIEYHPVCYYLLESRIAPAGVLPNEDGSDPDAVHLKVLYGITPSGPNSTLDFWALCRNFSVGDEKIDEFLDVNQTEVVMQDVRALNILEQRIAADTDFSEVSFKIDSGSLAARRMVADQIATN